MLSGGGAPTISKVDLSSLPQKEQEEFVSFLIARQDW